MNIYLIGYRATGKTAVGRKLAAKLNRRFIDADCYLEQKEGMSVSEIVLHRGWEEFRKKESDVVSELCAEKNLVVATGGGVIVNFANTEKLRQTGTVIWLDASAGTVIARMQRDPMTRTMRPPLTKNGSSISDEVRRTMSGRRPLYSQGCHMRINTDNKDPETLCNEIMSCLF